jgi:Prokaryotic membrane lipoprotein lipid attachment site
MKRIIPLLVSVLLLAGCATSNTIQSREKERAAAYASFSPEIKALVTQGRIAVGMPPAAVYIAWGRPAQVLQSGGPKGVYTTWVYNGAFLEETRYWAGWRFPHPVYDYQPRSYVRAEVIFANGVVQSWHTLPQPGY